MSTSHLMRGAERAARSPWVEAFGRVGYVARGVLYAAMSVLIVRLALGLRAEKADPMGTLRAIAAQPLGRVHVAAVAFGLAAYAAWRVAQAVIDPDDHGRSAGGLAKRFAFAVTGLLYAPLALAAVRLLAGSRSDADGSRERLLLAWRWGAPAVLAVGVVVCAVALVEGWIAARATFAEELDLGRMSATARTVVIAAGRIGFAAHAAIFATVGALLVKSAVDVDPAATPGIDGALARLAAAGGHGAPLVAAIGAGTAFFALFSFLMARYRRAPAQLAPSRAS